MLQVQIALPSGKRKSLTIEKSSRVRDLKRLAQKAFGQGFLGVVTAKGHMLQDLAQSLEAAGVSDGDHLTAVVQQGQLTATAGAFAWWSDGDDTIITWGHHKVTRVFYAVEQNLRSVKQVKGTRSAAISASPYEHHYTAGAFAAIMADGSVVAWGQPECGGNSSAVRDQLRNVQQIQATGAAFAAILADGSVVTWGDPDFGSDSSAVQGELRNVKHIEATDRAFAAILQGGSVVTWGDVDFGADSSRVQPQLRSVQQIRATGNAFAAILADGSVVTWGNPEDGGDSTQVRHQLRSVQQIQSTAGAFAAFLEDGSIVTWGDPAYGGNSSAVTEQLKNVQQVKGTQGAFAAILTDGSVVTWGYAAFGGNSSAVRDRLRNVQQLQATDQAFAAILADGSVVTWGIDSSGGDNSRVKDQLQNVRQIQGTGHAFAAILSDGSLVAWGHPMSGGEFKIRTNVLDMETALSRLVWLFTTVVQCVIMCLKDAFLTGGIAPPLEAVVVWVLRDLFFSLVVFVLPEPLSRWCASKGITSVAGDLLQILLPQPLQLITSPLHFLGVSYVAAATAHRQLSFAQHLHTAFREFWLRVGIRCARVLVPYCFGAEFLRDIVQTDAGVANCHLGCQERRAAEGVHLWAIIKNSVLLATLAILATLHGLRLTGPLAILFGATSILARHDVDVALVLLEFGAVVNKGIDMPIGDSVCTSPPFVKWHQLLLQNPVQDVKDLTFSWVIPFQAPFWRTKPSEYISHLLGHEGKGSIIAALKEQGLISACSAGNGAWLEGAFSLLNVTFELTDKGLDAVNDIGRYLFAYLGMLQKSAPEKRIFEEAQRLAAIRFKFKEDASPFQLCPDIALNLQRLPPSEALCGTVLQYEFDPEAISSLLSKLTLDTVRVQFQAKILAERCTQKDTSYGSPMELLPIDPAWLESWAGALRATGTLEEGICFFGTGKWGIESKDIATKMGLHLPPPNPFIPEDLSLKPAPADNPVVPQLLSVESGVSIFHRQDDNFKQPKARVTFYIYSHYFHQDVSSYLKTALWSQCVEEALQDYAYDAQIAGMGYTLQLNDGCLKMVLSGFNDKLHVLLDAVTEKMVSMTSVPEHIFGIIVDTFGDDLRNQAYHDQPISQAQMRFQDLLNRGSSFPVLELLETLPKIQRTDLDNLCQSLFADGAHVEVLSLGNLTGNDAKQLSNKLVTGLKLTKPLKSLPYRAEAAFPTGSTLWELDSVDVDDPNHAVMMKLQLPEGLEDEMHLMLLDKLLGAKFFEILRTQQQLGYIVQMGATVPLKIPQLVALAQTEFPPDYVRGCIGKFMSEHFEFIQETLTDDEFRVCKDGLLSQLRMKPKNLREEARRYARQMNDRSFDFGRRERGASFVETLTLESFKSYVANTVMKAPQIYIQVKKVLEKDDKALPSGATNFPDPDGLRRWSGNETTVKSFGDSARWYPVNASVAPAKL
eukprot:s248_g2.t1